MTVADTKILKGETMRLLHRHLLKCTQRTICFLHGKRWFFDENFWAIRGRLPQPTTLFFESETVQRQLLSCPRSLSAFVFIVHVHVFCDGLLNEYFIMLCYGVCAPGKAEVLWAVAAVGHGWDDAEGCSDFEEHICAKKMGQSALMCCLSLIALVGGVAQWLGRRSLAGRLSLILDWSIVDMWPLRMWSVHYGSANQANSAFHPLGVGKWVVINVMTWITGVETIIRQTRAAYGWLVVGQSVGAGL